MSVVAYVRIMACCALIAGTARAQPDVPSTPSKIQAEPSRPLVCIDGMEMDPDYDESDPTPVSNIVDGGCLASGDPIST